LFKDSCTGKESVSKTLFVISSVVLFVKILISGVAVGDWSSEATDFIGLAAVHAVFASAYYGRSKTKSDKHKEDK
jgi:hypothetical protein